MKNCCWDCAAVKAVVSQCLMYEHNSGITALACREKISDLVVKLMLRLNLHRSSTGPETTADSLFACEHFDFKSINKINNTSESEVLLGTSRRTLNVWAGLVCLSRTLWEWKKCFLLQYWQLPTAETSGSWPQSGWQRLKVIGSWLRAVCEKNRAGPCFCPWR